MNETGKLLHFTLMERVDYICLVHCSLIPSYRILLQLSCATELLASGTVLKNDFLLSTRSVLNAAISDISQVPGRPSCVMSDSCWICLKTFSGVCCIIISSMLQEKRVEVLVYNKLFIFPQQKDGTVRFQKFLHPSLVLNDKIQSNKSYFAHPPSPSHGENSSATPGNGYFLVRKRVAQTDIGLLQGKSGAFICCLVYHQYRGCSSN